MSRVKRLAELARTSAYELVQLDGRDAIRIRASTGSSTSFLTAAELVELRALLANGPPAFDVPGIGTFTWERDSFVHHADGARFVLDDLSEPPSDVTALGSALARVRDALPRIRAEAARQLAPLYNDTWRQGPRLTLDEITARLRLDAVRADAGDGTIERVTVWFDDGDLFAGHAIHVPVDLGEHLVIGRAGI